MPTSGATHAARCALLSTTSPQAGHPRWKSRRVTETREVALVSCPIVTTSSCLACLLLPSSTPILHCTCSATLLLPSINLAFHCTCIRSCLSDFIGFVWCFPSPSPQTPAKVVIGTYLPCSSPPFAPRCSAVSSFSSTTASPHHHCHHHGSHLPLPLTRRSGVF